MNRLLDEIIKAKCFYHPASSIGFNAVLPPEYFVFRISIWGNLSHRFAAQLFQLNLYGLGGQLIMRENV